MKITIPTATNIKAENANNTSYRATINGTTWSGIHERSNMWASVQAAIADGAEVEPYVEPVVTALDLLARTDAELVRLSARTIEDIIDERIAEGKFVAQGVKDKITERKTLRAQL
jgi:hypothetical protein